jgi:hypothetical protein
MNADRAGSRHERYRERLAALATDVVPVEAIVEAGRRTRWWSDDRPWVRTYARFHPDHEPFVTLVFEVDAEPQLVCHVDVFTTRPAPSEDRTTSVVEQAAGWFRVTRFPADDALPTLSAVLAQPGRHRVIRYRPAAAARFASSSRTVAYCLQKPSATRPGSAATRTARSCGRPRVGTSWISRWPAPSAGMPGRGRCGRERCPESR